MLADGPLPETIVSPVDGAEMVRIPSGRFPYPIVGLEHLAPVDLDGYLLDVHEVTNKEFKEMACPPKYVCEKCARVANKKKNLCKGKAL